VKHPLCRLQKREVHIGADIEDGGVKRCRSLSLGEKSRDRFFPTRIERATDTHPACCLDLAH